MDYFDREGNVVVDWDGRMFEYIFGFLRIDKFCLFGDFFDFDFLIIEVDFFDILNLFLCFKKVKDERLFVRYIEILEIKVGGFWGIVLKGWKEDLEILLLMIFKIDIDFEIEDVKDFLYVEIILCDRNVRF